METKNNNLSLSTTKLIYLIIFLLFIGAIILYAGGAFKKPKTNISNAVNNTSNNGHVHNSPDMNTINEIKALESIVNTNPNDFKTLLKLSHLLNDSGFYQKAIDNYKKYLEQKPNEVDVLIDMGVCYFQLRDYEMAIKTMEKGVALNPEHQIAQFNLGIVSSTKGDQVNAIKYWEKAVDINPKSDIGIKAQSLLDNH